MNTERYREPARKLVGRLLDGQTRVDDAFICRVAGISPEELARAREIERDRNAPKGMMAMMMGAPGKEYSREEVTDGIKYVVDFYGYGSLMDAFVDENALG